MEQMASPDNNTNRARLSATSSAAQLHLAVLAIASTALILWLDRPRLDQALLWSIVIALVIGYPLARLSARVCGASFYAVSAVCCAGGLVVLWALGAPRPAMTLALSGLLSLLGAVVGGVLNRWMRPALAAVIFLGGVMLASSWLGLGVLALAAWWSRAHPRAGVIAAWALGLGLAWGVYLPLLSIWTFAGFWWGFIRWLGL